MVAYSFKQQFVLPIQVGLGLATPGPECPQPLPAPKRQTIRSTRARHARPGEELQLYRGMRTKSCFLIGRARCIAVENIRIDFGQCARVYKDSGHCEDGLSLDQFARDDGFESWFELFQFWRQEHGNLVMWWGNLIKWEPIAP